MHSPLRGWGPSASVVPWVDTSPTTVRVVPTEPTTSSTCCPRAGTTWGPWTSTRRKGWVGAPWTVFPWWSRVRKTRSRCCWVRAPTWVHPCPRANSSRGVCAARGTEASSVPMTERSCTGRRQRRWSPWRHRSWTDVCGCDHACRWGETESVLLGQFLSQLLQGSCEQARDVPLLATHFFGDVCLGPFVEEGSVEDQF